MSMEQTDLRTLGDEFPKEQARVREILGYYKEIGPAGAFGTFWIGELLARADKAVAAGDVVAMIRVFHELQKVEA